MEETNDIWAKNFKNVTIKITDGSIMKGKINVGNHKRVSDLLKYTKENFVTVVTKEDEGESSEKVFIVNKNCIVWVESEDK